jgi:protein-S-isoprenylcysteine O-methyltransferase Ste14
MISVIRIFLLVVGNALALFLALLALETMPANRMGWLLFALGIAYGAGGAIHLWRDQKMDETTHSEAAIRSFWWLLPGFLAILFIPPLEFLYMQAILPRGTGMEMAGLIIILLGLLLRTWARLAVRRKYPGIRYERGGEVLITTGPYRFVRYPGYTGFLLMTLGLVIGYSSLIGLVAIPLLLLPGLAYRMKVDEDRLLNRCKDKYQAYAHRTKKLIPGVW